MVFFEDILVSVPGMLNQISANPCDTREKYVLAICAEQDLDALVISDVNHKVMLCFHDRCLRSKHQDACNRP